MRCVELFAGAGGAALGLEAAGIEHAALCEFDPDACATLRAAGLGPVIEGDVREQAWDQHAGIDLLWSSFPCQAFSTAGSRKGAADERNGWPWTVDAIDQAQPTWVACENVPGLTYHTGECDRRGPPEECPACYFEVVILGELRARFAWVDWWKLDAADYGMPQHRRRIFIIAGPHPVAKPRPTHCDPRMGLMLASGYRPWVSVAEALGLDARVIGGGRNPTGRPGDVRTFRDITDEPSTTVAAVQIGNAGPWIVAAGETGEGRPRDVCHASPTIGTKGTAYLLGPSPAVTCSEVKGRSHDPTKMQKASDALFLGTGRRRLTIEECAKLQDFPDDHPWQGTKTAQYRQVGNAVPPTLARVVGESITTANEKAPTIPSNSGSHHRTIRAGLGCS